MRARAAHLIVIVACLRGVAAAQPAPDPSEAGFRAAEARLTAGDVRGAVDAAAAWYEEAARLSHAPIDRWRARKASADLMVVRGDFSDADELYDGLRQSAGGAIERAAIDAARRELATRRARWHLELGA